MSEVVTDDVVVTEVVTDPFVGMTQLDRIEAKLDAVLATHEYIKQHVEPFMDSVNGFMDSPMAKMLFGNKS